ncbi:MAG: putative ABC-type multidrug transport system, ATPase and permease component [Bacteroidota bacterium]|jgi:ABC-type multidrug transport system fused ATPase/permease subunit|nr:putative ABC-type multidrug transport system, ATPase and permease component [Bacteroidota bacterium]
MARKVKETDDLPKVKINKTSLKKALRIFDYVGVHKWKLYLGLVFLVLTSFTALLFPTMLGALVNVIDPKNTTTAVQSTTAAGGMMKEFQEKYFSNINDIGLYLIVVLSLQSVFSYFRVYLFVNYTENTLASLRQAVYKHLISLPMSFFVQQRVGDLNSRMSADISQIQDTLTTTIAEFLRQFLLIVGGIILLLFISPRLTLLMLAIVPVVAAAAVIFGRFIRKTSKKVQEKIAESNTVIEETLQGISNVKAFANEFFENKRYKKSTEEIIHNAIQGGKYRGAFASFIIFCLFGSIVAVIWYGVYLAQHNQLLVGDLISFILYSAFVGASFGGIAELYAQVQKAIGSVERVFEILDEQPEIIEVTEYKAITNRIEGDVVFENLAFTYPSRKEIRVLKSISLHVKKGETIAIVGPSGSGKSTIVSLLLRFYDPESGAILIDGKDARQYQLTELRNNMAIVPQDVLLFGGTIYENIAYGKPGASAEEIVEAARKANALEFINTFPEKLETIVGERGVKLSGGQRQRIAIARAVLKDPSILILDEATSSLDSESERVVQEALDKLMVGRTSFVIAHRLSTIRKADKIVVIEKGEVRESGTHQELMQLENGLYRSLSSMQLELA